MAIEQISSSSTWGTESAKMNRNFQNLSVDVEKAKNASTRNKGLFPSESELKSAIPSPVKGDWAVVGSTIPGTIYRCTANGTWTNTGQQGGGGDVDLAGYTKKTDFDTFKSSAETELATLEANTGYVTCSTAAATAAKTVTKAGFVLSTGCRLLIHMTNANTVASPTLNVNNTGAKALYYNGVVASADNTWEAGEELDIYYNGTNYQASNVQGGSGKAEKVTFNNAGSGLEAEDVQAAIEELAVKGNEQAASTNYLVCSTGAGTAAKTIANPGFVLTTGCRLIVKMSNANTAASATLNVNNTGAKPLYYNGEVASVDNTWEAGEALDIYYDGTNYHSNNIQNVAENYNCINAYMEDDTRKGIINKDGGYFEINTSSRYYTTELIRLNTISKALIKIKGSIGIIAIAFYKENTDFSYMPEYTLTFSSTNIIEEFEINPDNYENAKYMSVVCQNATFGIYNPQILLYLKADSYIGKIEEDTIKINAIERCFNGIVNTQGEFLATNKSYYMSDFIPIDDSFVGISLFSAAEPTALLVAYYSDTDRTTLLLDESVPMGNTTIRKYIAKEDMPLDAKFFSFFIMRQGTPNAYLFLNKKLDDIYSHEISKTTDLRNIYENRKSFFRKDGTLGDSVNATANWAHIIVPVSKWKNFSFKLVLGLYSSDEYLSIPSILFLKKPDLVSNNIIDEFCFAGYVDSNYMFSCGFISDDDIPQECQYIAFNFKTPYIDKIVSYIRAEKRTDIGMGKTNMKLKYNSTQPIYAVIDVGTDDLSSWPNDKTEHAATVKMTSNGSILIQDNNATIEYQGSSTMAYPKKNFRIKFEQDKKIGDWPETKKYNVKAYYLDMTQMREILMYHIAHLMYCSEDNITKRYPFSDLSIYPTGARGICDLFPCRLNINGEFHGLYHFGLAKDKKNLLIDEENPLHFAFEPAAANNQTIWENAELWDPVIHDEVTEEMREKLQLWLDFLRTSDASDFRKNATSHLNLNSWLQYVILMQVIYSWDGLSNNMQIVTYDGGSTFSVFPYDGDNTFGFMNNSQSNASAGSNVFAYSRTTPAWMLNKFNIMFYDELCKMFKKLYDRGVFTFQTFCGLVDDEIRGVPISDYDGNTTKWGYEGTYLNYPLKDLIKWYKERLWFLKNFFRYVG